MLEVDRIVRISQELGGSEGIAAAKLCASRFGRPGALLAIMGAHGRGKSRLARRLCGIEHSVPTQDSTLYYGPLWTPDVIKNAADSARAKLARSLPDERLAILDCEPFDVSHRRLRCERVAADADLVLFCVQVTQPQGKEEVDFVTSHLTGRGPVLVITMADLADEEDFARSLEAILEAYSGIDWSSVLVSDYDGRPNPRAGMQSVDEWWTFAAERTFEAHSRSCARSLIAWAAKVRATSDEGIKLVEDQLCRARVAVDLSATEHRALDFKRLIDASVVSIPRMASKAYASRLPDLRKGVLERVSKSRAEAKDPQAIRALQEDLANLLCDWDQKSRQAVRQEMDSEVSKLRKLAEAFVSDAKRLVPHVAAGPIGEQPLALVGLDRAFDVPMGDLSGIEQVKPTLFGGVAGLSGIMLVKGAIFGALGAFAWPVALAVGLASGCATATGVKKANEAWLYQEVRGAVATRLDALQALLVAKCEEDWREFCYGIDRQLAPYARALVSLPGTAPGRESMGQLNELASRLERLKSVQREISSILAGIGGEEI